MATYIGPYSLKPTKELDPGGNTEFDIQESDGAILDHYLVTSNTALISGPNLLGTVALVTGTSVVISLYDNSTSTGFPIWTSSTLSAGGPEAEFQRLKRFKIGLYALVTGATSFAYQIGAREA